MGPTSANQSPMRVVFLRSQAAKARLLPALSAGNLEKTKAAPVVAITAYDEQFYEHLPFLFPHADAKPWFSGNAEHRRPQRLPERHVAGRLSHHRAEGGGLDTGPMTGFDNQGRRGVLPRRALQVERADQHRLRRFEQAVPP